MGCRTKTLLFLVITLLCVSSTGLADTGKKLEFDGYGEIQFTYFDHGADQTQEGGSGSDNRLVFDLTRFVLNLEAELGGGFKFESEIEFEHGGTGSALELEFEEFGEYEHEVENGGEVILEELYIEKELTDGLEVKVGRFYVAIGLLSSRHKPTDYLGSRRPESEVTVLPAVWDEIGIALEATPGDWELTLQLVNGLDSTGFSSQYWIGSGHQARFEVSRATDLAVASRVDYKGVPGLVFGASGYTGNTTGNRPKPDLKGRFAPVLVGDLHFTYESKRLRAQGVGIWGYLNDSSEISEKNRRLSNALGVLRSPIASQAIATWAEVGYDVAAALGLEEVHRIEPFVRLEYYDTMFRTSKDIFDNPRFKRQLFGAGVAYRSHDTFVATLHLSHRRLGSRVFNSENTAQVSLGFLY